MNIQSNPWNFVPGDIVTAAVTSLTQQAGNPAIVALVTAGALNIGTPNFLTIVGAGGPPNYNGWYKILVGNSGGTTFTLQNLGTPTGGLIASGLGVGAAGNVFWNQVQQMTRIEDISWQDIPVSASLLITDRNGADLWRANSLAGATNSQNRGKLMWANGVTIQTMTAASEVLMTIN